MTDIGRPGAAQKSRFWSLRDPALLAVALVAYANGVPFLAVRSLSDLAGGGDASNEMMTFMALASRNSATVVKAILTEMP